VDSLSQSNNTPAFFDQAFDLFRSGRSSEAEKILNRILDVEPRHFDALHLLGVVLSQQGSHAEGLRLLDVALQINNKSSTVHNSRGNLLTALGRLDEALTSFETAIALDPQSPIAFGNRGNMLGQLGRFKDAVASYDEAIFRDPDDAEAFYNRAGALQELKQFDEAVANYNKAIALRPSYAEAWSNRGTALQALERFAEAIASYDRALFLKQDLPEALCNRGTLLRKMKRFDEAIASFDRAIGLKRDLAEAWNYRGACLQALERFDDAVASFNEAIAIKPKYIEALSNRGDALRKIGKLEQAIGDFETAIALAPRSANLLFNLTNARPVNADDPHFAVLKDLAREAASLEPEEQIRLHFALGKAFADVGEPRESFHHLLQGNSVKRKQITYDEAKTLGLCDRIQSVFTTELMRDKQGLGNPNATPVFIIGMPRSGTTLIEQILASHPKVFGAGELAEFENVVAKIREPAGKEFPEAVPCMTGHQLRRLGGSYLQAIQKKAPMAERITDKMPANFRFLGLIHLALPNARIIHACRDPRDTAISCFSILFAEGQLEFTYDLAELGRYIRAYHALMKHWCKVLPSGIMLEVQYEELIDNVEAVAKRIIAHCGLEWNDACLDFHRTNRVVQTASLTQVRQPIYRTSVGRWRDYEDLLQPLFAELADEAPAQTRN